MTEMERMLKKTAGPRRGARREAVSAGNMTFRPEDPHGGSGTPDSDLAPGSSPVTGGPADLDTTLATLENRTRELVACADALEQRLERQVMLLPPTVCTGADRRRREGVRFPEGPFRPRRCFDVVWEKFFCTLTTYRERMTM